MKRGQPDVVGARYGARSAKADAGPGPRLEAGLGVSVGWFHRVSATSNRHDVQDLGLLSGHDFEGTLAIHAGAIGVVHDVWRARRTVEYIDRVLDEMGPEADGAGAGFAGGSHDLHDGSNGSLGDAVELVHVRRTSSAGDRLAVKVLGELPRHKLARVVEVQLAHDAYAISLGLAHVAYRVELGYKGLDPIEGVTLVLEEVYLLESGMVIHEHEEVRESV